MDAGEKLMAGILKHSRKCDLCKEKPTKPAVKTVTDPDWNDDQAMSDAIDNESGQLESHMAGDSRPRPRNWKITRMGGKTFDKPVITANPHHLIPGNESLKPSDIVKWIFGSSDVEADIGYDVNNEKNGVWLPSNNTMRKDSRWNKLAFKKEYVVKAMKEANGHFHDRHVDYSKFVKKMLDKIAARMFGTGKIDNGCPYVVGKKKKGKYPAPYFLVVRLNGVSKRLAGHLKAGAGRRVIFTSKLVKLFYWK